MSTSDAREIIDALGEFRRELRAEIREEIADHLRPVDEKIGELTKEVKRTNGSVRELKLWRARIEGAMWIVGRVPVIAAIAASIAAVIAVVHG